ncbi:MAG: RNA-binding transcriptional accessory protein [Caldilineaceae bacterium]|nr:RNA-binding transcriptional accessory protein [Caldilineaceae bacterium]
MDYASKIAVALNLRQPQVAAAVALLEDGNTIPFIARYRKEATGALDEEALRGIAAQLESLRKLDERRAAILASIDEQEKLTPDLQQQLLSAETLTELEDLYQPYRPKRRTRASIARDKGLQPLADLILAQPTAQATVKQLATPFVTADAPSVEEALAGARDIVAETISDHPDVRRVTREKALKFGALRVGKIEDAVDEKALFALYYDFSLRIDRIRPHQVLAINRGEAQKILRIAVDVPERDWQGAIKLAFRPHPISPLAGQLEEAANDAAGRLLLPAIERDVRRTLTEQAEAHAIRVFAANLRGLLTQPPLAGQTVLALDPAYRTGCKVAVVDPSGKLLTTDTIYPHEPHRQWAAALRTLADLVARYGATLIAIGNGTASRETEQLAAELIHATGGALHYIMVNEAGASVYSASPLARAELPGLDVSLRSAVSIARRVQDPLAELVKIDPKSIGVGLYQHDVDQKALAGALDGVVESVVNQVGVDVNTASPALLTYVAGVGPKLAEKIVEQRNDQGLFFNRRALRNVSGLGPKAFEQAAGFLRIREGDEPLDASAIHPESYPVARKLLKRAGLSESASLEERETRLNALKETNSFAGLAAELGAGEPTLADIFEQLLRPGRDPRADLPQPILRSDVLSMDDLTPGLQLDGAVRNVVDFGAFVDIGVKQDGLLHRSQIPFGTVLNVGDVIAVEVQKVEKERGRIALGWPGKKAVDWQVR